MEEKTSLNVFGAYILGVILYIFSAKIILEKVRDSIISDKGILEIEMLFTIADISWIFVLSILFLVLIYCPKSKSSIKKSKILMDLMIFSSWIIKLSINVIIILVLVLVPILKESFNFLIFLVLFCLYILSDRLKKEKS